MRIAGDHGALIAGRRATDPRKSRERVLMMMMERRSRGAEERAVWPASPPLAGPPFVHVRQWGALQNGALSLVPATRANDEEKRTDEERRTVENTSPSAARFSAALVTRAGERAVPAPGTEENKRTAKHPQKEIIRNQCSVPDSYVR